MDDFNLGILEEMFFHAKERIKSNEDNLLLNQKQWEMDYRELVGKLGIFVDCSKIKSKSKP
jgi:hypothetical protein